MERMRNKDLENAWAVQGIRQEKCAKLEEENKKLKEELDKKNELLSNVARCSEQYRGKMISIMNELKMFLYKD